MKTYLIPGLIAFVFGLFSCTDQDNPLPLEAAKPYHVTGQAQKGPFINGSDVNVYELDCNFKPTGRTFHTNTDQKGFFTFDEIELVSPYVEVLADGYYYNEVSGELSNERMILKAITDLSAIKASMLMSLPTLNVKV